MEDRSNKAVLDLQREVRELRRELERLRSCIKQTNKSTSIDDPYHEIYNGNVNSAFELETRSGIVQTSIP